MAAGMAAWWIAGPEAALPDPLLHASWAGIAGGVRRALRREWDYWEP
jgi:hypothetical protein